MPIPLVDLSVQYGEIADEVHDAFNRIMTTGAFIMGPDVAQFENNYAAFSGVSHCVGVASGTDALELCVRALGIGAGDEVILPANTFIASALAVVRAGACPVLVDADPDHLLIDVDAALAAVGPKTRAIMPVDLFGQIAPMAALEEAARDLEIFLIEDSAQAQGARQGDRAAGSFGDASGTSFYPGKNLGAFGDGGAVTTMSSEVAETVRRLRNYGSEVKYYHPETGFNSRLDTLQAAVLNAKLAHLSNWNELRRDAAQRYSELLSDLEEVRLPAVMAGNESVWHIYAIRVPTRDKLLNHLNDSGIGAGVHYPVPIHLQGAFDSLGHARGSFPVSEEAADQMISLPIFPGITEAQQIEVADTVRAGLR